MKTLFNQGGHRFIYFIFIFGRSNKNERMIIIVMVNGVLITFRPSLSDNFHPLGVFRWEIRCWNKKSAKPNLRMKELMVMKLRCGDGTLRA